ncbi:MAG TPA: hydrogenase formation protein HypD [Clostridia bacterium]|nr:hydrogenase formation protein HypD [Clostridia bacterium]
MNRVSAIEALRREIGRRADGLPETTVMEVCGTHTHAVWRNGIRQLLPANIRLVSGPGCPVCVTDEADLARALWLAKQKNVSLCCFGDMLRVPCGEESLLALSAEGADVRVCVSPLDALAAAREEPARTFVWFGVGFETTAPHTAALAERARKLGIPNLCILSAHKTMPEAIRALLSGESRVGALLCPGHVAAIAGAETFRFVPEELRLPAAVAGFEAEDILAALAAILGMLRAGKPNLVNAYPRAVTPHGNQTARALQEMVFEPCGAVWRGLGAIPASGLKLRKDFADLDAQKRFSIPQFSLSEPRGCRCAEVLRGTLEPTGCPLFGRTCAPQNPVGACMVSSEGACAAYYSYGGNR